MTTSPMQAFINQVGLAQRKAIGSQVDRYASGTKVEDLWRTNPEKFIRMLAFQQKKEAEKDKSRQIEQQLESGLKDMFHTFNLRAHFSEARRSLIDRPRRQAKEKNFHRVVTQEREQQQELVDVRRRRARSGTMGVSFARSPFTASGTMKLG